MLMHIVNSFSDRIYMASLRAVVQSLYYDRIIDLQRARLVLAGCDDNALRPAPAELRDTLRASIAKQLLLTNCE